MIYFDTDKEAYQQRETLEKWGKTYLTECTETEYQELQEGKLMWQGDEIVENPDYDSEQLAKAKQSKYNEALQEANNFLNNEALYELSPTFHVEATKENMNTLTSASIAIEKGLIESQVWTSKEDNVLALTQEQCMTISFGIGAIQGDVWSRQFIIYKEAIEQAETIEEVEAIEIDYATPIEESENIEENMSLQNRF